MQKIPLGLYSCVLAALVWIGFCGGVAVIVQYHLIKNDSAMWAFLFYLCICSGMAVLGVGLAIGSLKQANRKKVLVVLGLIFNGLFLLGPMGVYCLFWIVSS